MQLFNAAALTRPALTAPCIAAALPLLLQLTVVDEKLVRVVELGPFKQKVDDGLSLRKHTLECVEVRAPSVHAARPTHASLPLDVHFHVGTASRSPGPPFEPAASCREDGRWSKNHTVL